MLGLRLEGRVGSPWVTAHQVTVQRRPRCATARKIAFGSHAAWARRPGVVQSGPSYSAGDEGTGVQIVKRALEEPIRQIVANAGLEGSVVVEKVKGASGVAQGFDAEKNEYVDMMSAGILDPTKVERIALQNAASIASLLLTTEALITDIPEDDKKAGAPPMPHGGDF